MKKTYCNVEPVRQWIRLAEHMTNIDKDTLKAFSVLLENCVNADQAGIESGTFIPDSGFGIYGVKCNVIVVEEKSSEGNCD